jgi:Flp pilus assembly protein TadD
MVGGPGFWHAFPCVPCWAQPFDAGRRQGGDALDRGSADVKHRFLVLLCAALGACATVPAPVPAPPYALFHDELFAAPAQRIDADDVFALSEAMKRYVHVDIARQVRAEGPSRGLLDALYQREQLKLDYDAGVTRNAAQAFDARKGNCLSLVIMTAALAKELGLQVSYQSVAVEETWSRSEDLAFLSTHVNLTLDKRAIDSAPGYDGTRSLTVDFLPAQDVARGRTRSISEDTIVAMYMNNRSAEALARRQIDESYWWVRAAIVRSPDFATSYNTLGVVYLRRGDLPAAEEVFRYLLARAPRNKQVLSNLATVLEKEGRAPEANVLRSRLARLEPYAPYHFFWLGTAAMQRGDFATAKSMFAKEVDRADYCSEFHFWLGLANYRLGDLDEARKQLAIAMEDSTTSSDFELYAAKLERLRSLGAH